MVEKLGFSDKNKDFTGNIRKNLKVKDRLILSLDVSGKIEALEVLRKADNKVSTIKVGLELIYNEGLAIVDLIKKSGNSSDYDSGNYEDYDDMDREIWYNSELWEQIGIEAIEIGRAHV